jgi:hypothetical protein
MLLQRPSCANGVHDFEKNLQKVKESQNGQNEFLRIILFTTNTNSVAIVPVGM